MHCTGPFKCHFTLALFRELPLLAAQSLTKDMPKEQLERAKVAAISSVYMNLESRAVVAEDIGRQILTYGHRCALTYSGMVGIS